MTQESTHSLKKKVGKAKVSSEVLEVTKSVQCSTVDKTKSLSGNQNVMAVLPNINDLTSNVAKGLSSELSSNTGNGVTNTGCKVSSWGTPMTQDSSYSLMKKVGKSKVCSEE